MIPESLLNSHNRILVEIQSQERSHKTQENVRESLKRNVVQTVAEKITENVTKRYDVKMAQNKIHDIKKCHKKCRRIKVTTYKRS